MFLPSYNKHSIIYTVQGVRKLKADQVDLYS